VNAKEEKAYEAGRRQAFARLLTMCAGELGSTTTEGKLAILIAEREATVVALREVCAVHGSTEWDDRLWLPDVVEKHLGRQLDTKKRGGK
jgi:hypothetical protein